MLRRISHLSAGEWVDFGRAKVALAVAQLQLRIYPVGRLVTSASEMEAPAPSPQSLSTARRLSLAVDRAARHGITHPSCLARSLALHRLLDASGVHGSRVRVGVRHGDGRDFAAHAWVTYGDTILDESPGFVSSFRELDRVRVGWTP